MFTLSFIPRFKGDYARFHRTIVRLMPPTQSPNHYVLAETTIAQVLFFKFKSENASFRARTNKVTISAATLRELAEPIGSKVRAHQLNFLATIEDL
jgi:hypothetical protein